MSNAAPKLKATSSTPTSGKAMDPIGIIRDRATDELVIGLCGTLGSGTSLVAESMKHILETRFKYTAHIIDISDIATQIDDCPSWSNEANRVVVLQNHCDALREKYGESALSQLACIQIRQTRLKPRIEKLGAEEAQKQKENERRVYIIDSIKNPAEAKLLRKVYREAFFLIGIESPEDLRKHRLKKKKFKDAEIAELCSRDAKDPNGADHGQQVIETIATADIFLRNGSNTKKELEDRVLRFVRIMLGEGVITPTIHETSMYHAYVAAGRSACLSRQVGAAIVSKTGDLLSTGCNDVPQVGGGLYTNESDHDHRCHNLGGGECFNDTKKTEIYTDVFRAVEDHLKKKIGEYNARSSSTKLLLTDVLEEKELNSNLRRTRIKDLLEFSRAVHAEMEAIVSLARDNFSSTKETTLYCTTAPCHNCARHIVSAGIRTVYYVEPYAKSLSIELHQDAITENESDSSKVRFLHFEGIAPWRYLSLFVVEKDERKTNGKMKIKNAEKVSPRERLPLDDFDDLENKVLLIAKENGLVKTT